MSHHRGTSSFNYHLDHGFVVFKDIQLRFSLRRMCVSGNIIHFTQLFNLLSSFDMLCLGFGIGPRKSSSMTLWLGLTLLLVERYTSITMSQRSRAGGPSIRNPSSREVISDTVELCETEVCFLHIQLTGTNVLLPKYTRHLLRLTLSPQDLKQSLSLETNAVGNAVPCFPLNNVDDSHLCDECMKSTLLVVYHMLKSIF